MSTDERILTLRQRHAALDQELHDEGLRPLPDSGLITELKRQKLRIKDEIVRLSTTSQRTQEMSASL